MQINNEILNDFIACQYKAYRKSKHQNGTISDYHILYNQLRKKQRANFERTISEDKNLIISNSVFDNIIIKGGISLNLKFANINIDLTIDGIEFTGNKNIIPIFITPFEKVTKTDKLFVALQATFIQNEFNLLIENCKIVSGINLKQTKFKFSSFTKPIKKLITEMNKILSNSNAPVFFRNSHCHVCEFQNSCLEKLIERDDLSLMPALKPKEISQKNNRGVFSVKQLSYSFRPKKNPYRRRKFLPELKALAIREGKTFIQEIPNIPQVETEVFLDFEGIIDRDSNYLIGVIVRTNSTEKEYSFWANNEDQQTEIFIDLINLLKPLNSFTIYHYGSYEINALKNISKQLTTEQQEFLKTMIDNSCNILNVFSLNIYPPTYSNGLKDIARFLKFDWTEKDASGLQSTVWRYNWEASNNNELKNKLITYNLEDSRALMVVKDWIASIGEKNLHEQNLDFSKTIDIKNDSYHKWGNTKFELPTFDQINSFSHFDYQQKKIFLKSNKNIKKAVKRKQSSFVNKIDKTIHLFPEKCHSCNQSTNNFDLIRNAEQLSIDLKFTKNGIKKWIVLYRGGGYRCNVCKKIFSPKNLKKIPYYGNNLVAWAMHQYTQYNTSYKKVADMIMDFFNVRIPLTKMSEFKIRAAEKYKDTYDEIKSFVVKGHLLHVDETKASIKGVPSGYVWVFTNMDSVFYLFMKNRESDFLKDLLKDFKGVLVSDFYAGYDTLSCFQQKCLVHLIRDMNNDMLHNHLNTYFKDIVFHFGELLRKIIDTVNKYGLKKRNLNKHNKDVNKFYSKFINKHYDDELILSYQKRFQKNRDKLFTFLNHDGIPWNNNNAEHAIKPFAYYRRNNEKQITESGIHDFLILLSIQQTCKYRGINFLEFLKSGKLSIFEFQEKSK
ncbi:MAG: TM0106 family RecB-like putative nuclease [Chitinophagaceae bacterium]|nr:TM0106 family RecB-like putative nuclease [Chitinophagaceae bacterium]